MGRRLTPPTENNMGKLSVVVITYNEERKLRRCLEPIRWADELIVVDSLSTDGTLSIAEEFTDQIIQQPWQGFAKQRTTGMERASGDWVLFLDADEYVTPALNARLRDLVHSEPKHDGYKIHRLEHFLGYPLKHGTLNPSYQPRLLRRGKGHWTGGAHAHIEVAGELGLIHEDLYHDSHNTITDFITRINTYTTIDAQGRVAQGQRVGRLRVVLSPFGMAWKSVVVKKGYRDGFPGLLFGMGMGTYSFLRLVKVWQSNQEQEQEQRQEQEQEQE